MLRPWDLIRNDSYRKLSVFDLYPLYENNLWVLLFLLILKMYLRFSANVPLPAIFDWIEFLTLSLLIFIHYYVKIVCFSQKDHFLIVPDQFNESLRFELIFRLGSFVPHPCECWIRWNWSSYLILLKKSKCLKIACHLEGLAHFSHFFDWMEKMKIGVKKLQPLNGVKSGTLTCLRSMVNGYWLDSTSRQTDSWTSLW